MLLSTPSLLPHRPPLAALDFRIRVAVVGAGPAAFYAAVELLRGEGTPCLVDLFDRLPTPYGLVRTGVAPDRPKVKTVTRKYESEVESRMSRFRLFCNVHIGRDLTVEELRQRYHAVIVATGARAERRMGIAGEQLGRVYSAASFAAWYNGHPEHRHDHFDLRGQRAVVIGMGNVAMDTARLLCRTRSELQSTDIADHALDALADSGLREVVVVGRSGPAQAAFTPAELEELTRLQDADLVVDPSELRLDEHTQAQIALGEVEPRVMQNLRILQEKALPAPRPGRRFVRLRFWASPEEVLGEEGEVSGVRLRRMRAVVGSTGRVGPEATEQVEEIACSAVFRAIGSSIVPTPGVPYDEASGTIPHDRGQVLERPGGRRVPGLFVAGWAKRGPSGIIATNKLDAVETVSTLREAHMEGSLPACCRSLWLADIPDLLATRGVRFVTYADWKVIDRLEVEAGEGEGRPRRKFVDVQTMLDAISDAKSPSSSERGVTRQRRGMPR